jgi:PKD repeat protein
MKSNTGRTALAILVLLILVGSMSGLAGSTEACDNRPPAQPRNLSPAQGGTGESCTPALQSSAFCDPDYGDTHKASQWQVTTTRGKYSTPVFDSHTDTSHLTSIIVPSLNYSTTYYWRVRYQDNHVAWSSWSAETSFTTTIAPPVNQSPSQPSNISPSSAATDVILVPTLQASTFSDPDAGDTHAASQWQVRAASGDYTSPVFDSGTDSTNLLSMLVPSGKLSYSTSYYWRVMYQDNHVSWSNWSAETSFTTTTAPPVNQSPSQPSNVSPSSAATGVILVPTLQASTFSDPDAGDTHAASQWQVRAASGDYTSPVFDSGTDSTNLLSMLVPSGKLSYSTTYYWRVMYQDNHVAWSSWSAETSFTTQLSYLAAPTLISPEQSDSVPGTSVGFQWDTVAGAVDYKLVVSTKPSILDTSGYKLNMNVGNVTSRVDTGYPGKGTKYYWWVWAHAADGTYSVWSEVSTNSRWFLSAPSNIAAPALVSPAIGASVPGASVSFQWDIVTGAVDYKLLVSTKPSILDASGFKLNMNVGNVTSRVDTGYPANGTKYYWWVWAHAADGTYSVWSEVAVNSRWFLSVDGVAGLQADFEADRTEGLVNEPIQFTDASTGGITSWQWDFGDGQTSSGQNPSHVYSALGTYTVVLKVTDSVANSDTETKPDYITVQLSYISAPTLVLPEQSDSVPSASVSFQWDAVAGAADYRLLVSTKPSMLDASGFKLNMKVGNITSYVDSGYLRNLAKYYWWVWAYAADGSYSRWSEVTANGRWFTSAPSYIAAPALVSPAIGASVPGASVSFQWDAVAGAVDYKLLVRTKPSMLDTSGYKLNMNVGNATNCVDTGYPANGTKYYWCVWAYAADGSYSRWSEVTANGRWFTSVPSYLAAPALVSPAIGASVPGASINFQWNSVPGAVNYRLAVSTSSNPFYAAKRKINILVGDVSSYLDPGYPTSGTKYYWWVWAYAADGSYSRWPEVSVNSRWFTSVRTYIAAPALVSPAIGASVSGASLNFQWNSVPGAVNYRLAVSTSSNPFYAAKRKINILVGDVSSYLDPGYPANGTKYYWWVWAYAADGTYSVWSEVSANSRNFTNVA